MAAEPDDSLGKDTIDERFSLRVRVTHALSSLLPECLGSVSTTVDNNAPLAPAPAGLSGLRSQSETDAGRVLRIRFGARLRPQIASGHVGECHRRWPLLCQLGE